MIITSNLTKRFGDFVAVDHINLDVKNGEIFGFLGPNASGKTTTVRMLSGLLTPSEGSATVAGYDVVKEPNKVKEHIGYMSQRFGLYEDLTVYENMDFFGGIYHIPSVERKKRIEETAELVKIDSVQNMLVGTISGGMKQRLALACALIHEPDLLLLDEPTAGVDPILRRVFWNYFRDLNKKGVTIFINTHYMDEAVLCDRLGLINSGKLIAVDTPTNLKNSANKAGASLEDAFIALVNQERKNR